MENLIGYYNESGYRISLLVDGYVTDDLYHAGNSPYDSMNVVANGLPLSEIRESCECTGIEMSEERGVPWAGCEYEEEDIDVD